MTVTPNAAEPRSTPAVAEAGGGIPAAGAVLLWCVLAGSAVSGILLFDPPDLQWLGFLSPAGALRLLADLAVVHVLFLVPLFAWRKDRPWRVATEAAAAVVLTAGAGFVILDSLVGLGAGALTALIGFVILAAAGAAVWTAALSDRPALYYGVASTFALGVPLVAFFAKELFRIEASWLAWLSPFTAWRAILDRGDGVPWAIFVADLAVGVVFLVARRRRATP